MLSANNQLTHHPQAGLNPLVDAAAPLFSLISQLIKIKSYRQLIQWEKELSQALHSFMKAIQPHYTGEQVTISRYIMSTMIDDLLSHGMWERQWKRHSLLATLPTEANQTEQFFAILERIIQHPAQYIDLMELMYLCLSMGYKGQFQHIVQGNHQLELIKHQLYQHIRAYRGNMKKSLSIIPLKTLPVTKKMPQKKLPLFFIFIVTACLIMTIFLGLGYLMDTITHESSQRIATIENTMAQDTT